MIYLRSDIRAIHTLWSEAWRTTLFANSNLTSSCTSHVRSLSLKSYCSCTPIWTLHGAATYMNHYDVPFPEDQGQGDIASRSAAPFVMLSKISTTMSTSSWNRGQGSRAGHSLGHGYSKPSENSLGSGKWLFCNGCFLGGECCAELQILSTL